MPRDRDADLVNPGLQNQAPLRQEIALDAIEAAADLAYRWMLSSGRIDWAGPVQSVLGLDPEALGHADRFLRFVHPDDLSRRQSQFQATADERRARIDVEIRLRGPDGRFHWFHERGCVAPAEAEGGPVLHGVLRRIAERKDSEQRARRLANFDELTGHFNRSRLIEELEGAIAGKSRYGGTGSLLVVGLDDLAQVSSPGTAPARAASADAIVLAVGQRLDRSLRSTDTLGRLNDHTFGVVLAETGPDGAQATTQKIIDAVRVRPVETADGPVRVSVSIGRVAFPDTAHSASEALQMAETALQEAQRAGGGTARLYQLSAAEQAAHVERVAIGARVREAMRHDRLALDFEPVARADDGTTAFYECLLRLEDERGDLLRAGAFIPVSERLGLVRALDRAALDMTLDTLKRDPAVRLSTNLSGLTVGDPSWLRLLAGSLSGKRDAAERLLLEITETAAMDDIEESAQFVARAHALGCRVALDDFGAGFTSFRHLRALAIDVVKIDAAFTQDLDGHPDNADFIKALLEATRLYGMTTVAEGVSTVRDAERLRALGVDYLQGSLVAASAAPYGRRSVRSG